MKYIYRQIAILISSILLLSSCNYLDVEPYGELDDDKIWTSATQVKKVIASMYAGIPVQNLHQDEPWVGMSDECDLAWAAYKTYGKNMGNWTEYENFWNNYSKWYYSIRQTIELENKIHRCDEIGDNIKKEYIGEALFLRGYFYWMLVRQYGPVVILDDMYDYSHDFSSFTRTPYDQCIEYIVAQLDRAQTYLPTEFPQPGEEGRPRQITCKALKSIVLHHAASPQFNGGYAKYANFKNPDGTQLISTTYDEGKWRKAAQAAKEVIDIAEATGLLALHSNVGDINSPQHNPYLSYQEVHNVAWNKEILFGRSSSTGTEGWIIHAHPSPGTLGGVAPTQRLVDAFLMKNGKAIEEDGSGYVEDGWAAAGYELNGKPVWNPNARDLSTKAGKEGMIRDSRASIAYGHWPGHWNMYANREPRFYASIMYNKRMILPLPVDKARRDSYSSKVNQDDLGRLELYNGGVSQPQGNDFWPKTGYLTLKKVDPTCEMGVYAQRKFPRFLIDVHFRYAQILLNYIEALNEFEPGNPDIEKYWNMIRLRAGVPGPFQANPEIKGKQDKQLEMILRERLIELNMEGDRYFTTRRRLLAHKVDTQSPKGFEKYGDGGPMYGMDMHAGDRATNSFDFQGFYKRTSFETRVFREEFYLFPIPGNQVDISQGKVVQNPGWRD